VTAGCTAHTRRGRRGSSLADTAPSRSPASGPSLETQACPAPPAGALLRPGWIQRLCFVS